MQSSVGLPPGQIGPMSLHDLQQPIVLDLAERLVGLVFDQDPAVQLLSRNNDGGPLSRVGIGQVDLTRPNHQYGFSAAHGFRAFRASAAHASCSRRSSPSSSRSQIR